MIEDGCLELAQLRPWLDPELLDQPLPSLAVRSQRVGLASGAVERNHPQLPQVLAQRVLAAERLQLADHLAVPAFGEVDLDPSFDGDQGELLESGAGALGELGERE